MVVKHPGNDLQSANTLETHWELLHQAQWALDWICRGLTQVNPLGRPVGCEQCSGGALWPPILAAPGMGKLRNSWLSPHAPALPIVCSFCEHVYPTPWWESKDPSHTGFMRALPVRPCLQHPGRKILSRDESATSNKEPGESSSPQDTGSGVWLCEQPV